MSTTSSTTTTTTTTRDRGDRYGPMEWAQKPIRLVLIADCYTQSIAASYALGLLGGSLPNFYRPTSSSGVSVMLRYSIPFWNASETNEGELCLF